MTSELQVPILTVGTSTGMTPLHATRVCSAFSPLSAENVLGNATWSHLPSAETATDTSPGDAQPCPENVDAPIAILPAESSASAECPLRTSTSISVAAVTVFIACGGEGVDGVLDLRATRRKWECQAGRRLTEPQQAIQFRHCLLGRIAEEHTIPSAKQHFSLLPPRAVMPIKIVIGNFT